MNKLFFILLVCANYTFAQTKNNSLIGTADPTELGERLVNIAWKNYPNNEVFKRRITIAEKEVTLAKLTWTQNLRLFYNFNDQSVLNNPGYSRPIYGLGLGLSLGDLLTLPANTKIAKQEVKIAESNLSSQKLYIRAEVLKRYYNYLLAMDILKIRVQSFEDASSNYQLNTKQFKNGHSTLDQVDNAARLFYKTNEEKLLMETQLMLAKITLEEILGIKWEEVEAYEKGLLQKKVK